MKILVTGGAGYIGSHTVLALISAGYRPVIFDNFSNSDPSILERLEQISGKKIDWIEGDCRSEKDLQNLHFKHPGIGGVIHFAAFKSVSESVENPLQYFDNNVGSLLNVLNYCRDNHISNFVFSSSAAVYGELARSPVREDQELGKASSPYAMTKQMGEQVLQETVKGNANLRAIALRYFNPVGAHPSAFIGESSQQTPNNLIPVLMEAVTGNRPPLKVFGTDYNTRDGSCIRDYLHVLDLAEAHVCALSKLEKVSMSSYWDVFNVGTGTGSTVFEVLETFAVVNDCDVPHVLGPRRPGDLASVYANTDKAKEILGWEAQRDLNEALRDAWHWHRMSRIGTAVREWGTKIKEWFP